MGVLCGALAIFGLVFDDMNGGPNEGSVMFWLIFGAIALVGILLARSGFRRLSKEHIENDKT
jgi:hypothetical protein